MGNGGLRDLRLQSAAAAITSSLLLLLLLLLHAADALVVNVFGDAACTVVNPVLPTLTFFADECSYRTQDPGSSFVAPAGPGLLRAALSQALSACSPGVSATLLTWGPAAASGAEAYCAGGAAGATTTTVLTPTSCVANPDASLFAVPTFLRLSAAGGAASACRPAGAPPMGGGLAQVRWFSDAPCNACCYPVPAGYIGPQLPAQAAFAEDKSVAGGVNNVFFAATLHLAEATLPCQLVAVPSGMFPSGALSGFARVKSSRTNILGGAWVLAFFEPDDVTCSGASPFALGGFGSMSLPDNRCVRPGTGGSRSLQNLFLTAPSSSWTTATVASPSATPSPNPSFAPPPLLAPGKAAGADGGAGTTALVGGACGGVVALAAAAAYAAHLRRARARRDKLIG